MGIIEINFCSCLIDEVNVVTVTMFFFFASAAVLGVKNLLSAINSMASSGEKETSAVRTRILTHKSCRSTLLLSNYEVLMELSLSVDPKK